jgi:proteasome accessory factor A
VLQLIEEGHHPVGLEIHEPVEALQEISHDQERTWLVTLASGKTISAIDVQEQYLEAARKHCVGQDEETDWVLGQWESVLNDLRGDYTTLVGRVDWASKLWLLDSFREAERLEWSDPILKSLDLEYHNLDPNKGLYAGLVQEGRVPRVTTDTAIALAQQHPPRNTRAFGRGEVVRHLLTCGSQETADEDGGTQRFLPAYVINWSALQLRGRSPFLMSNPFKTYVREVKEYVNAVE